MTCLPALTLGFLLGFTAAATALDLTPLPTFRELEGTKIPLMFFRDGPRDVLFKPPKGWKYTGGGSALTLMPPEVPESEMRLIVAKRAAEDGASADPARSEAMAALAQTMLASDAEEITLTATKPSPFAFEGQESIEFQFEYLLAGRKFATAVAFADVSAEERLIVIVRAAVPNFGEVRGTAIGSLFSLETRPAETQPGMAIER